MIYSGSTRRDRDFVVVGDESAEHCEGEILAGWRASKDELTTVLLAVDPKLIELGGAGGYHVRRWGRGVSLPHPANAFVCPMVLWVSSEHRTISWAARLELDPNLTTENRAPGGKVRIAPDPSIGVRVAAVSPVDNTTVDLSKLGEPDDGDGWIIGGACTLNPSADGYMGFGLFGAGHGLRVVWSAIAQSA